MGTDICRGLRSIGFTKLLVQNKSCKNRTGRVVKMCAVTGTVHPVGVVRG